MLPRSPTESVRSRSRVVERDRPHDGLRVLRGIALDELPVCHLHSPETGTVQSDEVQVTSWRDLAPCPPIQLTAQDPPVGSSHRHFVEDRF